MLLLMGPSSASAQADFSDLWGRLQGQQNQTDMQQQQMLQHLMNDPNVWAGYQQHRANGGQGSYLDYALWWGRTQGGTQTEQWNQVESQIAEREALARRDFLRRQQGSGYDPRSQQGRSDAVGGIMQGSHVERFQNGCFMVPDVAGAPAPYQVQCPPWL